MSSQKNSPTIKNIHTHYKSIQSQEYSHNCNNATILCHITTTSTNLFSVNQTEGLAVNDDITGHTFLHFTQGCKLIGVKKRRDDVRPI